MILRKYTPVEFNIIKSWAMTLSRSVMDEKSLSLLVSVVGGRGGGGGGG